MSAPLLEVNDLKKHFPVARRPVRPQARLGLCGRRRVLRDRARRDAGAGRRVRLRQVDGRPRHPAAVRHHRRPGGARRPAHRRSLSRQRCGRCAAACRWCSRTRSRASIRACACATSWPSRSAISASPNPPPSSKRRVDGADRHGAPAARRAEPLAARILRRPAPAHRHRAGARGRARPDRLRRGGLGARRLGQGADRQSAAGSAARARPRAAVHQPRPRDRRAHDPPRRGDVSRQDRRDGAASAQIFAAPKHPYTKALLSAVPVPEPGRRAQAASSSRATCRARSTRRAAAASTPAAPMCSTAAGPRSRSCGRPETGSGWRVISKRCRKSRGPLGDLRQAPPYRGATRCRA